MEKTGFGQRLIKAVRAVAAANPGHIYKDVCQYVNGDGEPACIVGRGLWNLGIIDSTFHRHWANDEGIDNLREALLETDDSCYMSEDEADWLKSVQDLQDNGHVAWGEAVATADSVPYQ